MHRRYWKFQSENVQIFGYVYQNTKWPKSWSTNADPVVPLERNLYGRPLAGLLWERQFEKVLLQYGWKKFQIENAYSLSEKKDYSCLCTWTIENSLERNRILTQRGKLLMKDVDLGEPTSFLDHVFGLY